MARKILFLILTGITFLYAGLYSIRTLLILFWMEIILSAGMFVLSRILRAHLQVEWAMEQNYFERQAKNSGRVLLKNHSVFPILHCRVLLEFENERDGKKVKVTANGAIPAKQSAYFAFPVLDQTCGIYRLSVKKVMVRDYIGFFCPAKNADLHRKILILPRESALSFSLETYPWEMNEQEYCPYLSKTDEPDDFQLRQYLPGDHPKSVHWKLLARTDELWAKSYQTQQQYFLTVFLDFYDMQVYSASRLEAVYELLAAISGGLLQKDVYHKICWYDFQHRFMREVRIENHMDFRNCMEQIFQFPQGDASLSSEDYHEELLRSLPPACISLNLKLELSYRWELKMKLEEENLQEQLEKGWVVI